MSEIASPLTVRNLLCHRDVDMALICLGSLLKFSAEPIHLIIHDDGSLTPEDKEKLLSNLKGSTIFSRVEADELMNQQLKNHPSCYRYRYEQAYSLKLLDIPLLSQGDIAYCDSDILFLRPFSGMFRWSSTEVSAIFMMDCREAYSVLPWHLLGKNKLQLPSKINAGLIFLRKKAYDLDFIEWCLSDSNKEFRSIPNWIEQTCWAALAYKFNCQLWNPEQIVLVQSRNNLTNSVVAGHFVSTSRQFLSEYVAKDGFNQDYSPVDVETIPSKDCSIIGLSSSLLRHKLGGIKYAVMKNTWKGYKARWEYNS